MAVRDPQRMGTKRAGTAVLLILFAVLLLGASSRGPDLSNYEDWTHAAFTLDLDHADTSTISPLAVPVVQWSHGTGFVFAIGHMALGYLTNVRTTSLIVGWLASLVFWAAMLRILWLVGGGDRLWVVLGAGMAFVGMHAGVYSHVHASESLAMACVAVLLWRALEPGVPDLRDALLAGVACGFLVTIKAFLVLYGIPLGLVLIRRLHRGGTRPARYLALGGAFALPVVVGVVQVSLANRWMTGSLLQSAYTFGDEAFRSFDFAAPELGAVLAHPWHGLLSYQPLYALGGIALVAAALRARSAESRIAFASGAVVVAAHTWVQAAWVAWWLGTATFGMRGLAPAAPLFAAALVWLLTRCRERRPRVFALLMAATVACCLWSFLLLLQRFTNFHDWSRLLAGQREQLGWMVGTGPLVVAALAAVVALLLGLSGVDLARRPGLWSIAIGLVAASMYYLGLRAWLRPREELVDLFFLGAVAAALLGVGLGVVYAVLRLIPAPTPPAVSTTPAPRPRALAALVALLLFIVASALFGRLALHLEADIAAGRRPAREYEFENAFNVMEMRYSCLEYLEVEGFEAKRQSLREFLLRQPGMTARRLRC